MNSLKIITKLVLAFLFAASVYPQKEAPPAGGKPKNFELPKKTEFILDNGMHVTKVHFGNVPKVSINLVIRVGNLNESENEVWLSDITGELLTEGTKNLSSKQIAQKSADMGGSINVSTDLDETNIEGNVLSDFAPDLISLISDVVMNPTFNDDAVNRVKRDYLRNLSIDKSQSQRIASEIFRKALYPDHPYGRVFPTEEMINNYTRKIISDFYNSNYGAQRAHIYICGNFDDSKVDEAVKKSFSGWEKGPDILINIPRPASKKELLFKDRPGAKQSTIYLGLPVIDPSNPDFIKLSLMNTLLGGFFSSRVTRNIREDKGYTYSPRSMISTMYRSAFYVQTADVTTDVTAPALKEIFKEIDSLKKVPPSKEELDGVKNYIAGIFVLRNSSPGAIISQLSYIDLHGLGEDYLNTYVQKIYDVTPEEISEMAKEYLNNDKMTLVVVGDKKIEKTLYPFGKVVLKD